MTIIPPTVCSPLTPVASEPSTSRARAFSDFLKVWLSACLVLAGASGCRSGPRNRVQITDYRTDGGPALHYEDFDEAYYHLRENGLIDLVLRKVAVPTSLSGRQITQVIHLSSYWRPVPGRTYAEDTMLNANLSYVLLVGNSGVSYEGGGFFQYSENPRKGEISGRLEGADLQPLRVAESNVAIFQRVGVEGRFKAQQDERMTTRIINHVNRLLGPLPRIGPEDFGPRR